MNVLTYGTFDMLHIGHINLLKKCREIAGPDGTVHVGVSTESFTAGKGKQCFFSTKSRMDMVSELTFVDHVFEERCWRQKADDVIERGIHVLVMGDDWEGEFDHLACNVVYVPRTVGVDSTGLRAGMTTLKG